MTSSSVKCPRCGSEDTSLSISIKLGSGGSDPGLSIDRITCKSCGFDLPLGGLSGPAAQALLGAMGTAQAASAPASAPASHAPTPPPLPRDFEPITVAGPGAPAVAVPEETSSALDALPAASGESDILLEIASPEIYRRNAFRVTGLSLDASTRDLDRASEKLRMLEKFGGGAPRSGGPLPLDPPPGADQLREAVQRLHDPEGRLVDELFWFWPEELGRSQLDAALAALGRGDLPAAERAWKDREREGTVASISTHNLAVLAHAQALDLELGGSDGNARTSERDRLWREALRRWLVVLREQAFWERVEARVRELDDPRLTRGSVLRMRSTLPKALLAISAQLALAAAEHGDLDNARRHVEHMRSAGFDSALVDEALRSVLEPQISRLRMLAKRAEEEGDADPEHADEHARRLMEQAPPLLAVVDALLEPGHPARATIHDEVALHLLGCQITHGNKTGEWSKSIGVLLPALDIVEGDAARTRIDQNLTVVRGNEELRAVWGTCWFCKEERPAESAAINVNMFGEVERTPTFQGTRITWRKGTIGVPRCAKCEESHLTDFLWYLWFPLSLIMPYIFMPASWIRFVPRFKKYPTPAMGGLLGCSLGMLVVFVFGWAWQLSVSSRADRAYDEAVAAKWATQSGLGQLPGGDVTVGQGLTQTAVDLIGSLRYNPSDDEQWGDLGDAYSGAGNGRAAEGCWAVAHLLDLTDPEWSGHSPDLELADDVVLGAGILDGGFVQNLAQAASNEGEAGASRALYELTLALDPTNSYAQAQLNAQPSPELVAAVAAVRSQVAASGTGGAPGGMPGGMNSPQGFPPLPGSEYLVSNVRSGPSNDELWGDLGDAYSVQGNAHMAEACWAVALLLDPTDSEWQGHSPRVSLADDALLELGVLDPWFVAQLGDAASAQGYSDMYDVLYDIAAASGGKGSSWDWADPSDAVRTAVADAQRRAGVAPATDQPADTATHLATTVSNSYNDEEWGDLGDAYAAAGDATAANACWAVALLRDEYDQEWIDHRPDTRLIVDFLLSRSILLDDQFVGELARAAENRGETTASRQLFDLAWALDPADPEWQDMNKGRQIPAAYASVIATARTNEEETQRAAAITGALSLILMDPVLAYNWNDAGNQALAANDTALAMRLIGMAHIMDPTGGWSVQYPGAYTDPKGAAEAVRAVGITDDEAVGRLAKDLKARGQDEAAGSLFALALELDPDDPEWQAEVERAESGGGGTNWILLSINALVVLGASLYGVYLGRARRRKLGLADKPRKTKNEGWKMEFPPIKEKLAAGWQLGDQPADATGSS
jgi:tetratricopeptide (TPR) repeat protein